MMKTFETEFDIEYLIKSGVIIEHFPCHKEERENIIKSWKKFGVRLSFSMVLGNFWENMQPINFIADYYGEEFAFYFAWLVHYTGYLTIPSLFGLIIFILQLSQYFNLGSSVDDQGEVIESVSTFKKLTTPWDAFNSNWNSAYAIFVVIWLTVYLESWKRTQSVIASKWLVNDIQRDALERPDYISVEDVDPETRQVKKINIRNITLRKVFIAFPISVLFMALVVVTTVGIRVWYEETYKAYYYEKNIMKKYFFMYIPTTVQAIFIVVYGALYKKLVFYLVAQENHRYDIEHENSLI